MKTFVTGGTGFVGSHLVELLQARGYEVTCLVRDRSKAERIFGSQLPHLELGDLNDIDALMRGAEGAQLVFHVAALTAAKNPAEFRHTNVEATRSVVEVTRRASRDLERLVYVSSLAALGPTRRGTILPDDATPRPVTAYGESKLAGEEIIKASDLPWTVVRPPAVYGPRDRELLKLFAMVKKGWATVFGDGAQELTLIHVSDLAQALLAAAQSSETVGESFFATHPEVVTQVELVYRIHKALAALGFRKESDEPRVVPLPETVARISLGIIGAAARLAGRRTVLSADKAAEFLAEAWTCSPRRLKQATDWSPTYDSNEGLFQTAKWYRDHQWL